MPFARSGLIRALAFRYQTGLSIFDRMPNGRAHSSGAPAYLGHLSASKGDLAQAEARTREALDISRQTLNGPHPRRLVILTQLAEIRYLQGAYADAEKEAAHLLDLQRRSEADGRGPRLPGLCLLSLTQAKAGRPASASAFLREALALFDDLPDAERYDNGALLGEALAALGREAEAGSTLSNTYEYFARAYGEQNPKAVHARQLLERLGARPNQP